MTLVPLTFRHWSRVTLYTSSCEFAECCVFGKQSPGPLCCDPPPLTPRGRSPPGAPLFPKLRGHFAEFLNVVSLAHLRLLASSTCVGLRYGFHAFNATGLFWAAEHRPIRFVRRRRVPSRLRPKPCTLGLPVPADSRPSILRHPFTPARKYRNINLSSIDYAFRPRLRVRLTLGGRTCPRKPRIFGGQDSHLPFRYSCLHLHLSTLQGPFPDPFDA